MNTKPVDVLYAMDTIARLLRDRANEDSACRTDVQIADMALAAYNAIAELIAAIDEWSSSREAQLAVIGTDAYPEARERHEKAAERFDAALVRVKGEAS